MATRRTRTVVALLGLFLLLVAGACSSDSASGGTSDAPTTDAPTTEAADPTEGSSGVDGDATVPSDLPLESVVRGLEVAMDPEEVEIEGDTIHVYLAEDNGKVPAGTECTIITSVLPEGASAVVHRGGEDTTC